MAKYTILSINGVIKDYPKKEMVKYACSKAYALPTKSIAYIDITGGGIHYKVGYDKRTGEYIVANFDGPAIKKGIANPITGQIKWD